MLDTILRRVRVPGHEGGRRLNILGLRGMGFEGGSTGPGRGGIGSRDKSFEGDAFNVGAASGAFALRFLSVRTVEAGAKNAHLASGGGGAGVGSGAILRNPAWTRKSHTRLVLLTSILTRSRASRRRSFPPLRAYSRTSVSLMTRYGFGKMRSWEQRVCSAGVRRWSEGLLARFKGAAEYVVRLIKRQSRFEQSKRTRFADRSSCCCTLRSHFTFVALSAVRIGPN